MPKNAKHVKKLFKRIERPTNTGEDFRNLKTGKPVAFDDPARGIWYSAGKNCNFWTDDWNRVKIVKAGAGIPVCPHCGSPGYQIDAGTWEAGARRKEAECAGYLVELASKKNRCETQKVLRRFLPEGS